MADIVQWKNTSSLTLLYVQRQKNFNGDTLMSFRPLSFAQTPDRKNFVNLSGSQLALIRAPDRKTFVG